MLTDIVIVVSMTKEDGGVSYPYTKVYRYEVEETNIPQMISVIEDIAVHGGQMTGF